MMGPEGHGMGYKAVQPLSPHLDLHLGIIYQHLPTGCLETLTGGFWAPVVTRKHLLEGAGIYRVCMTLRAPTTALQPSPRGPPPNRFWARSRSGLLGAATSVPRTHRSNHRVGLRTLGAVARWLWPGHAGLGRAAATTADVASEPQVFQGLLWQGGFRVARRVPC